MSNEFWQEVESLIQPVEPIVLEYRLYYNEEGDIISGSMAQHADGNYIVVTQEQYAKYFNYRVVNGTLKEIDTSTKYYVQLKKSTKGFPVVRGHAGLIIEDEEYPEREYYDLRTN